MGRRDPWPDERRARVDEAGRSVQRQLKAVREATQKVRLVGAGAEGRHLREMFRAELRLEKARLYARSLLSDEEVGT